MKNKAKISEVRREYFYVNDDGSLDGEYGEIIYPRNKVKKYSLKEDKFVPKDKMSKKAQKELNDKKRGTWGNTNPVTRVQPNKKAYDRKRDKKKLDEVITNYSQEDIKEIKKISMTCFDIVRRYYNNLYNRGYPYSSVLDFADALRTCAEQIDSFINKTK